MKFLFNVDADTPTEKMSSSAIIAASSDATANAERLLAMLRENRRHASKVKRSGTALLPIVVDGPNSLEEAESRYVEVGSDRSYMEGPGDELECLRKEPRLGQRDTRYHPATLNQSQTREESITRASTPDDAEPKQLQECQTGGIEGEDGSQGSTSDDSRQEAAFLQVADTMEEASGSSSGEAYGSSSGEASGSSSGGGGEEGSSGNSKDEASRSSSKEAPGSNLEEEGELGETEEVVSSSSSCEGAEIVEFQEGGYEGDEEGGSNGGCSEVEEVIKFEETESDDGDDGQSSSNDSSEEIGFVKPDDDIFGPGWCDEAWPVQSEEDEDWGGDSSDSSYKECSSDLESSENGGEEEEEEEEEEEMEPLLPRRIIYLGPDRFVEQVLGRRAPMYGVDTRTARDCMLFCLLGGGHIS